jgi:hypothetical protein
VYIPINTTSIGVNDEAVRTKTTKEVHQMAETFIGLIQKYLIKLQKNNLNIQKRNLMIIIINADNIAFEDLKQAIDDIFAAVTDFDQKSALTLVHSSEFVSSYEQQP